MITKTSPLRRATLLAAACLALCSGAAFAEVKAKIGHAMPDSHPQAMAMNKFSELAAQYTGNNVKIQVFHGAVLGSDEKQLQAVQLTQLLLQSLAHLKKVTQ